MLMAYAARRSLTDVKDRELRHRLLGRPASESGRLGRGDGGHRRGDRCLKVFMLITLQEVRRVPSGLHGRLDPMSCRSPRHLINDRNAAHANDCVVVVAFALSSLILETNQY